MLATTLNSTSVWLLTAEPQGGVKITVSRLTDRHAGRTRREERRILGATLRWKLDYATILDDRLAAQAFRLALKAYANEPILCPFWPAAQPYGETLRFTGGIRCTWEPDFTQWELHTSPAPSTFTPTAAARTAPVLWGRFDKLPDPDLLTSEIPRPDISFVETGPRNAPTQYAIAPAAGITPHTGPALHGETWPLLDFDLNYEKTRAGGVDVQVSRQQLGFGRVPSEAFFPQTPRAIVATTAVCASMDELARLVATFHASGGTVSPLWFPSTYAPTRITANTSSSSSTIAVENGDALGGHPHILLREFYGANVARTITAAAADSLTLDSPPGDFSAEALSLQLLFFGRFSSDDLVITWKSPVDITAQFALTELPPEYGDPAGETHGETLGDVGAPICLLEITDQVGGAWYWTNYESGVVLEDHTYSPEPFGWSRIQERLNLDDADLELTVEAFAGNPFMRLTEPHRGQQLSIVLKEWDASGTSPAEILFRGYAVNADPKDDTILHVPVTSEGKRLFDLRVPRRLDGPTCPWIVYGPGCDLSPAAKAISCTVQAQTATLQFTVATSAVYAGYFAGGWLRRLVPGEGNPTYGIIDNTATAGGTLTLTIDTPLSPDLDVGEVWTLYPGCDQSWERCGVLGNQGKFGGARKKPAANPAFTPVKQTTPPSAKK